MQVVLRTFIAYGAYVAIVTPLLLAAASSIGEPDRVVASAPSTRVVTSISVIGGTAENSVFCWTVPERVTTDALAVNGKVELEALMRDLGCAP